MNIKQLSDILAQYPDNMRVLVNGYQGGFEDLEKNNVSVDIVELYHYGPTVGTYGPHEIVGSETFEIRLPTARDNLEKVLIIGSKQS